MSNTYALNVTRGKEFAVEAELREMGLDPWVPRQLVFRSVREKTDPVWYDRPYVSKMVFCAFPAVYYLDVIGLKHVIGKPLQFSQADVEGREGRNGLADFKRAVEGEYADMAARRDNSEWVCGYEPGQALKILEGPFEGLQAVFRESIRRAEAGFANVRVEVDIFGRATQVELRPSDVSV